MRVKVTVSQKDIRAGMTKIRSTCGCPIWHALRRAIPSLSASLRLPSYCEAKDRNRVIRLPKLATEWQMAARFNEHAYPFAFDVEV